MIDDPINGPYDGSDAAFGGVQSANPYMGPGSGVGGATPLGTQTRITYEVIEAGPMPIRLHYKSEDEFRTAAKHIHVARVLMAQMVAASGPVVFQKMQRRMPDQTLIVAQRNQTTDGAEPIMSADIYPPAGGGEVSDKDERHRAPFIWVGMKHDRDPQGDYGAFASIAIWEPGSPEQRWETAKRGLVGGQVLIPTPSRGEVANLMFQFQLGSSLKKAFEPDVIGGLCETPNESSPSAVAFEPWEDVVIQYTEDSERMIAVTNSGLFGGVFETEDILNPDEDGPWEQFYLLDPGSDNASLNDVRPPDADVKNKNRNDFYYPQMQAEWMEKLSREDRRKLVGHILPGKYLLRFGVSGMNFKPGQMPYVQDAVPKYEGGGYEPPESFPSYPEQSVPIIVKIVTGKFPYITVDRYELTVSAKVPSYAKYQFYPRKFSSSAGYSTTGGYYWVPRELGPGEELEDLVFPDDYTRYTYMFYINGGGPVPLGEGTCINDDVRRDWGEADGTTYDPRIIEIDPWGGSKESVDKETWGMP